MWHRLCATTTTMVMGPRLREDDDCGWGDDGESNPDLHERDLRDRAGGKCGEVDFEIVGVEPHRHVEQKACGDRGTGRRSVSGEKRHRAGGRIAAEPAVRALIAGDRE